MNGNVIQRRGIVTSAGNRDYAFVTDLESGEIFFCHHSCVIDGVIPELGDKVSFDHLPMRVGGKQRPISRLDVL